MGNPLVRADSTWFYYDLEKGCPVRVPESQLEGYQIEDKSACNAASAEENPLA